MILGVPGEADRRGVSAWFAYISMGELAEECLVSTPTGSAATQFVTTDYLGPKRLVTDASGNNGNEVSRHD